MALSGQVAIAFNIQRVHKNKANYFLAQHHQTAAKRYNCYIVPFLIYSASKNVAILKPGVGVIQGH